MANPTISVKINLNGLRGELQRSLQKVICFVSNGLESGCDIEPDRLVLPTNIKSSFSKISWNKDEFNKKYTEWILSNGFRDVIESVNSFLDSAHEVLSIWEILEKKKSKDSISGEEWSDIVIGGGKKFHRMGLPDKLSHISDNHGIEIKGSYKEQILSINAARNCFVHRNGIVSKLDVNENDELVVKWIKMRTILQNEDGEQDLIIGEVIEKESTIGIKFEENEKSFSLGTSITFSTEEVSEVMWCLFLFGIDLVMNISKFGEINGFVSSKEETSA